MVELDEVAEGVGEPLDQPVQRWDCFKSICLWKIAYKYVSCQFLGGFFFSVRVIDQWNGLPPDVKASTSVSFLKNYIKRAKLDTY